MNLARSCYIGAAATWITSFAYLQLSLMPQVRQCILENSGLSLSLIAAKSCATQPTIFAMAGLIILSVVVTTIGLRKGYFAQLYTWTEHRKKEWLIPALIVAVAALPYLSRGNVALGDAMQFSALSTFMKESLRQLSYPYWTFYWYMGSAPLAFYGWLSFLVTGAANLFVSIDWANKIIFFAFHILSALAAYKFVKTATNNTKAAVVAALVYGLSFEHIGRIMVGRSITALTYLLTPLLFLAFELRLNEKIGKYKFVATTAATVALLIFNHQADAAFITAIFAIYAALRTLESGKSKIKAAAAETALSFVIAAAVASFWAAPMLLERGEASATGKALEIFTPAVPQLNIVKELVSWPGKWGDKPFYYVGLSSLLFGAIGIIHSIKNKKIAVAVTTAAAALLMLIQSPRYMPAMLLMTGMAAGYGFIHLSSKVRMDSKKLLFIAAAVMVIDMVPATMQLGYPDFSYNKQFYSTIHAQGGERVLDLSTDRRTFWPSYAYMNNQAETVFGTLIESAPRSLAYAAAITNKAATEYYDRKQSFSEETLQGLYMLGVKYVIVHTEQIGKSPHEVFAAKRGALGLERGLEAIQLRQSPVIAAKRKTTINYAPMLEKLEGWKIRSGFEQRSIDTTETDEIIKTMKLNTEKAVADTILVKEGESEEIAPVTTAENLAVEVKKTKTEANKVEIDYDVSSDAFLQLSYSYSPHFSVKIDRKETAYWKTAISTIAVKTTAGRHTLTIEAKQGLLRKQLMLISAAAAILIIYLFRKKQVK